MGPCEAAPRSSCFKLAVGVSGIWGPPWRPSWVLASSLAPPVLDFLTQPSASQDLLSSSPRKPEH